MKSRQRPQPNWHAPFGRLPSGAGRVYGEVVKVIKQLSGVNLQNRHQALFPLRSNQSELLDPEFQQTRWPEFTNGVGKMSSIHGR